MCGSLGHGVNELLLRRFPVKFPLSDELRQRKGALRGTIGPVDPDLWHLLAFPRRKAHFVNVVDVDDALRADALCLVVLVQDQKQSEYLSAVGARGLSKIKVASMTASPLLFS